ncbi:MAG TPA: hypothetical protein VIF12_03660 [Micavibrio sp.]|jgi:hypothetical protein
MLSKKTLAAGILTALFISAGSAVPAMAGDFTVAGFDSKNAGTVGYYWESPAFQGPPKGMFKDLDLQHYYETTLWPETMKARGVWANKRQEIDGLLITDKLAIIGNHRKTLKNYEMMHDLQGEDCSRDRMGRGLLPHIPWDDVKWEI